MLFTIEHDNNNTYITRNDVVFYAFLDCEKPQINRAIKKLISCYGENIKFIHVYN